MSGRPLVLRVAATHLYPGARAMLLSEGRRIDGAPCLAEFSDGAAALGEIASGESGRARLRLRSYRTGAGTEIPAKTWEIEFGALTGDGLPCRVARRAE